MAFPGTRTVDFEHQFSKKSDALRFPAEICGGDTKVSISRAGQSDIWDVQVSLYKVLTHAAITEVETRLGTIARRLGGTPDGAASGLLKKQLNEPLGSRRFSPRVGLRAVADQQDRRAGNGTPS